LENAAAEEEQTAQTQNMEKQMAYLQAEVLKGNSFSDYLLSSNLL
jgi:hypothetical protein